MRGFIFAIGLFIVIACFSFVSAASYEQNFTITSSGQQTGSIFTVQSLKYEPYPVEAGEWFDLWVKVANIGQDDSLNTKIEFSQEYPFSTDDSGTYAYDRVSGTSSASMHRQNGEIGQDNQLVLKFRVKVADSASAGQVNAKIKISDGLATTGTIYSLPITIGKPKTDFDVVMQRTDGVNTYLTLTNIGEGKASSIIVKVNNVEWKNLGDSSYNSGSLNPGDFVRVGVQGLPTSQDNVKITIEYTDISGVRRSIDKEVMVLPTVTSQSIQSTDRPYLKWVWALIGVVVGIAIMIFSRAVHKKRAR